MRKKISAPRGKPFATHIDLSDISEPGIYGKNVLVSNSSPTDEDGTPLLTPDVVRGFNRMLELRERQCQSILRQNGTKHSRPSDDSPEIVKDAWLFVESYRNAKLRLKQGDFRAAIVHAYEMGKFSERIDIRWAEPLVTRERRRIVGADKKRSEKAADARTRYARLRKLYPKTKMTKESLIKRLIKEIEAAGERLSERSAYTYLIGLE